uniref:Variant surface glycoprotein 1125.5616 n=1 Tax=Trypanosoma brucei TaxID=5691 RepID=A0A1J0RCR6_9TRYP|nr:variant surface glycoprotein 1125.5616 [Trypanosoma brucei]
MLGAATIALVLLVNLLATRKADATVAHAGSPASGFRVICNLINLASMEPESPNLPSTPTEIEETVALINLTLMDPKALEELTAADDVSQLWEKEKTETKTHCAADARERCQKAVNRAKSHGKSNVIEAAKRLAMDTAVIPPIAATIEGISRALKDYSAAASEAYDRSIAKLLKDALGGKADGYSTIKLTGANSNRQTTCGTPSRPNAGTAEGRSLAIDVICLCGSDTTSGSANDACSLHTPTGSIAYNSAEAEVQQE